MGVHDFSCAIYSKSRDGWQCLEIIPLDTCPTDANQLVTLIYPDPDEENMQTEFDAFLNNAPPSKVPDPLDFLADSDNIFDGYGTTDAVLEFFVFPPDLEVTSENFLDLVRDGKYEKRFFREYKYSWDAWDFHSEHEEEWLNYQRSSDMTIVWRMELASEPDEDKKECVVLRENPNKQVWVRNFSKHAFDEYISSPELNPRLSNIDMIYIAFLYNVDYRGKTRKDLFTELQSVIHQSLVIPSPLPGIVT
jgi:hypothetical protein